MIDFELLDLIAKGETEDLLLQNNLTGRLNTLAAKGLVDICDGKILITPKGKQVQKEGSIILLENIKLQKEMEEFSARTFKRNTMYVYLCLFLLCTAAVYLFSLIIQGY